MPIFGLYFILFLLLLVNCCIPYLRGKVITPASRFTSVIMLVFVCAEHLRTKLSVGIYA